MLLLGPCGVEARHERFRAGTEFPTRSVTRRSATTCRTASDHQRGPRPRRFGPSSGDSRDRLRLSAHPRDRGHGHPDQAGQTDYQEVSLATALQPPLHRRDHPQGREPPGTAEAIISQHLWDDVHAILQESPRKRASNTRAQTPALLKGLLYGPDGAAFSPTHTRKGDRLYRYYVSQTVLKHGAGACPIGRVPAAEVEAAVIDQLRMVFRSPR